MSGRVTTVYWSLRSSIFAGHSSYLDVIRPAIATDTDTCLDSGDLTGAFTSDPTFARSSSILWSKVQSSTFSG